MKERVHLSAWRSPEAEQRFRSMADALAAELVADRPTAVDVETRLGPTRVYRWEGTDDPVVLLHGTGGTSLTWAPLAERRGARAMVAIDTIGDVGGSRQGVAVRDAGDLADWLAEALAQVGLDHVHLAGTSYGGFLALNLAVRRPEMVRSLYLVDPAGLVRVRMLRFLVWGTSSLLASRLPTRPRLAAARRLRMPALEDPRILRLAFYGQRHHRARLLRPEPLTDPELRAIAVPVQLVLGARSEVFPPDEVRRRAEALVSKVAVEVVEDAGHAVSTSHLELVADRLASFLEKAESADR